MSNAPKDSEVAIFRKFSATNLISLQHQLYVTYLSESFLRDRIFTAVDIPAIPTTTLRYLVPLTSQ